MAKANSKFRNQSITAKFFGLKMPYVHRPKQIRLANELKKKRKRKEKRAINLSRFGVKGDKGN